MSFWPKQILNLCLCILLNFISDFCWMCCGDWRSHGSEYYECSRYKSNPNIVNESAGIQAREALKKYLFYFERVIATEQPKMLKRSGNFCLFPGPLPAL